MLGSEKTTCTKITLQNKNELDEKEDLNLGLLTNPFRFGFYVDLCPPVRTCRNITIRTNLHVAEVSCRVSMPSRQADVTRQHASMQAFAVCMQSLHETSARNFSNV